VLSSAARDRYRSACMARVVNDRILLTSLGRSPASRSGRVTQDTVEVVMRPPRSSAVCRRSCGSPLNRLKEPLVSSRLVSLSGRACLRVWRERSHRNARMIRGGYHASQPLFNCAEDDRGACGFGSRACIPVIAKPLAGPRDLPFGCLMSDSSGREYALASSATSVRPNRVRAAQCSVCGGGDKGV
jgi:hypothetical protein